jgi:hypothetical protein
MKLVLSEKEIEFAIIQYVGNLGLVAEHIYLDFSQVAPEAEVIVTKPREIEF